ncbi:MAG: hypothetical protein ACLQK8_14355 [Streptosporangiaceae bacterium]
MPVAWKPPADWASLRSPENHTGYECTENFASPGGAVPGEPHVYTVPARLRLNQWALSGTRHHGGRGHHAKRGERADRLPLPASTPATSTSS